MGSVKCEPNCIASGNLAHFRPDVGLQSHGCNTLSECFQSPFGASLGLVIEKVERAVCN